MVKDILFLSGSYESQRIAKLDRPGLNLHREIKKHFIYSCLLADQVIQPIGHYYQSEIIRSITQEFRELFTPCEENDGMPIACYAINMLKENFQEDADEKAKTFLGPEFLCYHDDEFRTRLTSSIQGFSIYRRQGKQLDTLSQNTLAECAAGGSLYKRIYSKIPDTKKVDVALEPLLKAVQIKEYAILPEYVEYLDENHNMKNFMTLTRIILMESYAESCAQLYNTAYVNNPIKKFYPIFHEQDFRYELHYLDTNIFDIFLSLDPEIKKAVSSVDSKKLISLKKSIEFIRFKDFYIRFIEGLEQELSKLDITNRFLSEYTKQQNIYQENVRKVIEDHPNILYHALADCFEDKKILDTSSLINYEDTPIMGFFSEVLRQVMNRYEEHLFRYFKAKQQYENKQSYGSGASPAHVDQGRNTMKSEYEAVKIGVITALPKECAAVLRVLQNGKECFFDGKGAGNRFYLCEINGANDCPHKIAVGFCGMGNNKASIRASDMIHHFPNIDSIIMLGIAGGIPSPDDIETHVRLGDVVVSQAVIQYDFLKSTKENSECRAIPTNPSAKLLEAVEAMEVKQLLGDCPWESYIAEYAVDQFAKPACDDVLHDLNGQVIPHPEDSRRKGYPHIFKGIIASANILLKDPERRQRLKEEYHALAVEMEASGIADATWENGAGYLVIRGISDYCDGFKNDVWQSYAAAAAACYMKALIENLPSFN